MEWREEDLPTIRKLRHRARTDLIFLCNELLGFKDVNHRVHGPMIAKLVQFDRIQGEDRLEIVGGQPQFQYIPKDRDPAEALADVPKKKRLILDPRSWFKTSINCVAHSIQINLNFPDIAIAIIHAKSGTAEEIVGNDIKPHYISNKKFRWLFPEFCTPYSERRGEYVTTGNMSRFTTPARTRHLRFPTFSALGANSALAGKHYHWIKFTDIVNEQNALSPDQLAKVTKLYTMSDNLLVDPRYYVDVEGTCYDFEDTYNLHIIEAEEKLPPEQRRYEIFCRGCFERKPPDGEKEQYLPDEREWPFVIQCPNHPQEEGNGLDDERCGICGEALAPVSRWPERWSTKDLLAKREDDNWIFACQQLNAPNAAGDEGKMFPVNRMVWVPEAVVTRTPYTYYTMSVDLAEKTGTRNDFTAMNVIGWENTGRGCMVDGVMGKWLPADTIDLIFHMYFKWKCTHLKIEESSFTRGLEPAMQQKMVQQKRWVNLEWIKRDPGESKKTRIDSLQPFFLSGSLKFSEGLNVFIREQLLRQFDRHPSGRDDLLDSIADQYQGKVDFAYIPSAREQEDAESTKKHIRTLIFDREEWKRQYGLADPYERPQSTLGVL